jgi:hypothetical protein
VHDVVLVADALALICVAAVGVPRADFAELAFIAGNASMQKDAADRMAELLADALASARSKSVANL